MMFRPENKIDRKKDHYADLSRLSRYRDAKGLPNSKRKFMRNIDTTLLSYLYFDTFCYAFPKTMAIQEAYQQTVNDLETLMSSGGNEGTVPMKVPTKQSIKDAEELVADFRQKFPIRGSNGILMQEYGSLEVCLTDGQINRLQEEIDNSLPHYTVFAVGEEQRVVKSNWAGQILVSVNPVLNIFRLGFFDYEPKYSQEVLESLESKGVKEKLWEEVTKNMQLFETSRQLVLQIHLKKISSVELMAGVEDPTVGILKINLIPPEGGSEENKYLIYLQRFIATNFKHLNKMKERSNFLPFDIFQSQPYDLLMGGPIEELSDVLAVLLTAEPRLKETEQSNEAGEGTSTAEGKKSTSAKSKGKSRKQNNQATVRVSPVVKNRRKSILALLLKYEIISEEEYTENLNNPKKLVGYTRRDVNNYLGGLVGVHPCLHDYANFWCKDAGELEDILSDPLNASEFHYCENMKAEDLGISKANLVEMQSEADFLDEEDSDADLISNMKVGHFVKLKPDHWYYSFCGKEVTVKGLHWHCRECSRCMDHSEWHCNECKLCVYGSSIRICDNCGPRKRRKDDKIRQFSLNGYYDPLYFWEPRSEEEKNVFTDAEFKRILNSVKRSDILGWNLEVEEQGVDDEIEEESEVEEEMEEEEELEEDEIGEVMDKENEELQDDDIEQVMDKENEELQADDVEQVMDKENEKLQADDIEQVMDKENEELLADDVEQQVIKENEELQTDDIEQVMDKENEGVMGADNTFERSPVKKKAKILIKEERKDQNVVKLTLHVGSSEGKQPLKEWSQSKETEENILKEDEGKDLYVVKIIAGSSKGKQPLKERSHGKEAEAAAGCKKPVKLEELLSDRLGLMDQESTVLGPAARRRDSREIGREERCDTERARDIWWRVLDVM